MHIRTQLQRDEFANRRPPFPPISYLFWNKRSFFLSIWSLNPSSQLRKSANLSPPNRGKKRENGKEKIQGFSVPLNINSSLECGTQESGNSAHSRDILRERKWTCLAESIRFSHQWLRMTAQRWSWVTLLFPLLSSDLTKNETCPQWSIISIF